MGYGGKIEEQARARGLRAESWTLADIAAELGVAKSSVSRWVRDVDFVPNPRRTARNRPPNKLQRAKADQIERCRLEGIARVGTLTDRELLIRRNRHVNGCCHVGYGSVAAIREVKGMMEGLVLVPSSRSFRGSSAGRASDC